MKWYIGQEVVAIKTHSQGMFKKGDVFKIKGFKDSFCNCKYFLIDIGIHTYFEEMECHICGGCAAKTDNIAWFDNNLFIPLDFDISELTKILETPLELIKC